MPGSWVDSWGERQGKCHFFPHSPTVSLSGPEVSRYTPLHSSTVPHRHLVDILSQMHNLFYLVCCAISLSTCHTTVQCCAINTLPTGTAAVADSAASHQGGTSDAALCGRLALGTVPQPERPLPVLCVCARVCLVSCLTPLCRMCQCE